MSSIWKNELLEKIQSKKAVIGIIGLGYVGSGLADLVLEKEFRVIGLERTKKKAHRVIHKKNFTTTTDPSLLQHCDIVIICIQTPIYEDKTPNLEFLKHASKQVAHYLRKGQLITIESSINPGITRHTVLPVLEESQLMPEEDFFLAFSPERIDPGNTEFSLGEIPKVVSGLGNDSLTLVQAFYEKLFTQVVPVSSLETAEMVKIFENTFRLINISLVNELKEYTQAIDVDMWEVIRAASTKPFGFMPHFPSPGVGGHCIPVDPFYVYYDAKKRGIELSLIAKSGEINDKQPYIVVENSLTILQSTEGKNTNTPLESDMVVQFSQKNIGIKGGIRNMSKKTYRILLIGVAYKPNIDDTRESAAAHIWDLFEKLGHQVSYYDPYVPMYKDKISVKLSEDVLTNHDIYIIVTNHSAIDYSYLAAFGKPIVDTRHAYPKQLSNIYYV